MNCGPGWLVGVAIAIAAQQLDLQTIGIALRYAGEWICLQRFSFSGFSNRSARSAGSADTERLPSSSVGPENIGNNGLRGVLPAANLAHPLSGWRQWHQELLASFLKRNVGYAVDLGNHKSRSILLQGIAQFV